MLGDLDRVDLAPVVDLHQEVVLLLEGGFDLLPQDRLVEQVLDPDADPVDLVGVRRTDATAGGADLGLAQEALGHLVDHLVVGRDDVRVGRDDQVRCIDPACGQTGDLGEQHIEVDHHAVADHRHALGVQNARGQQVQRVPLTVDDDRMAGVVATRVTDAVVDPLAELIGGLALAFVAPLRTYHHNARHVIAALLLRTSPYGKSEAPGHLPQGLLRPDSTELPPVCRLSRPSARKNLWSARCTRSLRSRAGTAGSARAPRCRRSAAAATASAYRARRKPRLGACSHGIGPDPFQPDRRSASRPR